MKILDYVVKAVKKAARNLDEVLLGEYAHPFLMAATKKQPVEWYLRNVPFVHNEKTARRYNLVLQTYHDLETDEDLAKAGLTREDLDSGEIALAMEGLRYLGKTATGNPRIKQWLWVCGCDVEPLGDGWLVKL